MEIFKLFDSIFVDNKEANASITKTGAEAEKTGGLLSKIGGLATNAGKLAADTGKVMVTGIGAASTTFGVLSKKALSIYSLTVRKVFRHSSSSVKSA